MNVIVIIGASSGMGREFVFAMEREFAPDEILVIARKEKAVSIKGFPVRMQVRAVKHLPVSLVMRTWCRQQRK